VPHSTGIEMLNNLTNRYFVPAPRLMLDPVDAVWRTKIKWFQPVHIANVNDATKSEKASTLILD
jgi:hypothetical protein